jgi:hypothetical protein
MCAANVARDTLAATDDDAGARFSEQFRGQPPLAPEPATPMS